MSTTTATDIAFADSVDMAMVHSAETRLKSIADVGASAMSLAESIQITTKEQADDAAETAKKLNSIGKDIEAERKAIVAPFNAFVDQVNAIAKRYSLPFTTAAKKIGNAAIAWHNAESMRIMAERKKAQQEREAALLANKPAAALPAVAEEAPPKVISTRKVKVWTVVDFDAVPNKYKKTIIDEDALDTDIKSGAVTAVPGVTIEIKETPIFR